MNIQTRMQQLIEGPDSPCQLKLLGPYFTKRFSLQVCFVMSCLSTFSSTLMRFSQVADLVLHWDALFLSTYLSWRLYKVCVCLSHVSRVPFYLPLSDVPYSYFQARWSAERRLADVWGTCLVQCCAQFMYVEVSFRSIFSQFWSASSCPFSSWSMRWRSGSINFFMVISRSFPLTPSCTTEHSLARLWYVFITP